MKTLLASLKSLFFILPSIFLFIADPFQLSAQGTWIEQAVRPTMSGATLTKTGSNCIIHTRASSRYVYFFDINCKRWTEIDLGNQQTIKAVDAGKNVVFAYTDSLLVAYSSVTSTYQVIDYYGNILSPNGPGNIRGYGCGDNAAYGWTDENYFYVFDALAGQWKSFYTGALTNATGTGSFWCGDNYVAGVFQRNYPDKCRNVAYSLVTKTFNSTETGGIYVATGFSASMTGGFVSMWGGEPEAISFAGYSAFTNEFSYADESTPYGAFYKSQILDESWAQFKERNVFGYCITRGTGYGEPRDVKINVFDTKRAQWISHSFSYSSLEFSEVGVASAGGDICTFMQQKKEDFEYPVIFYVYKGETGSYQVVQPGIYYPGYLNSGNNFSMFLDEKKNNWVYNSKTGFNQKTLSDSSYLVVALSSDYISFRRFNPSASVMDICFYNSQTDRLSKIQTSKDVYSDFKFSPQAYIFAISSPENHAIFYSPIHDSILKINTAFADGNSSYGAYGVFAFFYNANSSLLFDAVNMKATNMNAPPAMNGLSDSLVLFQSGNTFVVYDASTENTTTFDMGGTAGYANNGGNTILLSNSNFSRFYAFQKGIGGWVELIPEGNSLWYSSARNTAVVARNTKVYAFAPDGYTDIEDHKIKQFKTFTLDQNYPNPFYPTTTISCSIPKQSFVELNIVNALGTEVATLVSEDLPAGTHTFEWDASGLPIGVYFCRLQVGDDFIIKKLVMMK